MPSKTRLYNPIGRLKMGGIMQADGFSYTGTTDGRYASTDFRRLELPTEEDEKEPGDYPIIHG